ncbi:MAG: AAA family ATPase [Myxococcota bacterium]
MEVLLYRFGPFELDPARFELRREGTRIEVQPKVLDLILYLVRNRHRVVARDEVLREVWPDAVVTDASLAKAVRTARRTLDDEARTPRRIQTVRGRGLRFIEPVDERGDPAAGPGPSADPFVGRESVLAAIEGALASACEGAGRLVLLEGEAGMGKTRTAREAARLAGEAGLRAIAGWCPEREPTPTLFPFVEALREWLETAADDELRGLESEVGSALGELATLLGGRLARAQPALGRRLAPQAGRERLVDAVGRLVEHAARSSPLLMTLDDFHRADGTSAAALDRVSHALADRPIVLLATYRPDELPDESPIQALARRPEAVRVVLEGMSLDEIARLVRGAASETPTPDAIAGIHAASGGNPFFAVELARSGKPAERSGAGAAAPLPPAIRHVLREARARLPRDLQQLLAHAAVAGREVDPGAMARALGRDAARVTADLDAVAHAGRLLHRDGRFAFAHDLVRRAIVEDLSAGELAGVHRRVGEALAERVRGASDPLALRAAYHLCRGAPDGGAERAVVRAVEAGEQAMLRYAHEEAAELLAIAADVLGWLDQPDPALELRLQLALGEARVVIGERAAGRESLRSALALARARSDREATARAALAFGGLELSSEVLSDPELVAFLEDVLRDLSAEEECSLRARIAVRLSIAYALAGRPIPGEHVRWIEEAARASDDPVTRLHALYGRRWMLVRSADLSTRLAEGDHMLATAERTGSPELALAARSCRFLDRLELGRTAEADLELEAYAALAEVVGVGRYPYRVGLYRAARATLDGRLADAERLAAEAFAEGRRIGAQDALNAWLAVLFVVRREQGRHIELLAQSESIPEPTPSVPTFQMFRATGLADGGRRDEVRATLPGMTELLVGSTGPGYLRIPTLALAGELAADLGLADVAAKLLGELEPLARRVVVVGAGVATFGAIDRPIGRLAATLGDLDGALAYLDEARELETAMNARPWLAWTELARARVLARRGRRGDRGEAERAHAAAAAIARDPELARLRSRLAAEP